MDGESHPMTGFLDGRGFRGKGLEHFGYVEVCAKKLFGEENLHFRAHEFHYFDSSDNGSAFHAAKPKRSRGWDCMQAGDTYAAGFPHLYYYSNPEFAVKFVETCRRYQG